jgi:hypothetical protein
MIDRDLEVGGLAGRSIRKAMPKLKISDTIGMSQANAQVCAARFGPIEGSFSARSKGSVCEWISNASRK